MRILVDTNVLARLAHKSHPHTAAANAAIHQLWADGHELRIVPQVLYEYWSVATRPIEQNGLGFATDVVDADIQQFSRVFSVLRDERGILEPWRTIAAAHNVQGKQAHDVRLVAAMQRHALTHLLTFNVADFQRYAGVELLDPQSVATGGLGGASGPDE
jgi:predicted nucleic acid-binding protein